MLTFPPVNIFPDLLNYADFGPLILRLFAAALFAIWLQSALASLKDVSGALKAERIISSIAVLFGILLLAIGLYTQIAVLILIAVLLYQAASRGRALPLPQFSSPEEKTAIIAALIILISILLTGAGAYSIDLPL